MEKLLEIVVRTALTSFIAAGGAFAASQAVRQMQLDAKGAIKMGISYSKFDRILVQKRASDLPRKQIAH